MTQRRDLFERLVRNSYDPYRFLAEAEGKDNPAEPEPNPGGYNAVSTMTNIKDLKHPDTWKQLTSGDENAPLVQAIATATRWSPGAFEKAGGPKGLAAWANEIGQSTLEKRIKDVSSKLPSNAPAKKDMPALEGGDADEVADALSPGGEYTVDIESPDAGNQANFEKWFSDLSDEDRAAFEKGEVPNEPDKKEEGYSRLASAIFEDRFPRFGNSQMPGAPLRGEKQTAATRQELVGKALAFLTKGQLDGTRADDQIEVGINGTLNNGQMEPTQSNILAGKSLLFAFLHGRKVNDLSDMGGAFVTSGNEILDGHHRWSGARIATGGSLTHSGVHSVKGDAETLIPLLVSVANAFGRGQKGVPKKDESLENKTSDRFIFERWQKIAGTLKG